MTSDPFFNSIAMNMVPTSVAANENGFGQSAPQGLDLVDVAAEHGLKLEEAVIRRVLNEAVRLMQASLDLL